VPVIRCKSRKVNTRASSKYIHGWNLKTVKAVCLLVIRPLIIFSGSSVAIVRALYLSISYGYLSLVGAIMATTFLQVYGFSESSSGLVFISSSSFIATFMLAISEVSQPLERSWDLSSVTSRSTTPSRMAYPVGSQAGSLFQVSL
jgi:hypothetical protein